MKNQSRQIFTQLWTILVSCAAILWSTTKLIAWVAFSTFTWMHTMMEACHAVAVKETAELEIKYNYINYPDEVSPNF
jgi:hypothetical protein